MGFPKLTVRFDDVSHDIPDRNFTWKEALHKGNQALQKLVGETSGTRSKVENIERSFGIDRKDSIGRQSIANKAKDEMGKLIRSVGVASQIRGNSRLRPGSYSRLTVDSFLNHPQIGVR